MIDVIDSGFDAGIRCGDTVPEDMTVQRPSADTLMAGSGGRLPFRDRTIPTISSSTADAFVFAFAPAPPTMMKNCIGAPSRCRELSMASERQIAANRRNAQNSVGPRFGVGKSAISRNAHRHGLAVPMSTVGLEAQLKDLVHKFAKGSDDAEFLAWQK